ncbi:MAG: hypothetical protein ACTH93_02230 [Pseudoclavibacter sp.]
MKYRASPPNEAQLKVLAWVRDGCPDGVYSPTDPLHRASARALVHRDLVTVSGKRKTWKAAITEDGLYYLEHGSYPPKEPTAPTSGTAAPELPTHPKPRPSRKKVPAKNVSSTDSASTMEATAAGVPMPDQPKSTGKFSIPMPSDLRGAHKAVREIVDHKARLDVPADQRQRALLILHALTKEADRRGWEVTANPSTFEVDSWNGRRRRVSPGPDLFYIDAGAAKATVRLRMQQRRVDHVPTKEEVEESARYHWQTYPRHDLIATDRMRLELRSGSSSELVVEDTVATRIEDKLLRVIDRIEQMTIKAREQAERHRLWELERLEQQRQAAILRQRAVHFGRWKEALDKLQQDLHEHQQLTHTVAQIRTYLTELDADDDRRQGLTEYVLWTEALLSDSDPLRSFPVPDGPVPDLNYQEWLRWKRQHTNGY